MTKWIPVNFKSFVPYASFVYPRKTSENRKVFYVFRGKRKGALGTNELINDARIQLYEKRWNDIDKTITNKSNLSVHYFHTCNY